MLCLPFHLDFPAPGNLSSFNPKSPGIPRLVDQGDKVCLEMANALLSFICQSVFQQPH